MFTTVVTEPMYMSNAFLHQEARPEEAPDRKRRNDFSFLHYLMVVQVIPSLTLGSPLGLHAVVEGG